MSLAGPLHQITADRLTDAAAAWNERVQHFPRPWHALLVGGHSAPYVLDAAAARGWASRQRCARDSGGSLLVTTSAAHERRSGRGAVQLLGRQLLPGIAGRPGRRTIHT